MVLKKSLENPALTLVALLFPLFFLSCSHGDTSWEVRFDPDRGGSIYFHCRKGDASPGESISLLLKSGGLSRGVPLAWNEFRIDYLIAREGGEQWVIHPGKDVVFKAPGSKLVAFSAKEKPLKGRGQSGGIKVSYSSKAIIRVNPTGTAGPPAASSVTAKVGLPLEIVPLCDPISLKPGDDFPLQVVLLGEGVKGAFVKAELEHGRTDPIAAGRTREGGFFDLRIYDYGKWLVTAKTLGRPGAEGERVLYVSTLLFEMRREKGK